MRDPHWRETNLARIVLARNRPGGGVAVGAFLVDTGCLGVKVAFGNPFLSEEDYRGRLLSQMSASSQMVPCDPALAARIVREAVAYAADLGFDPDPDFHDVRWLFGEIEADASSEAIPLGRDGMPFYVAGPDDDARAVLARLRSRLGEDGFHFIVPADGF